MTKTAREKAERSRQHRQELIDRGFIDPNDDRGEDGLSMLDLDNNDGEHLIALNNIRKAMEDGVDRLTAMRQYGIPGHPYYAEIWPVTRYWGEARLAREKAGLSPTTDD